MKECVAFTQKDGKFTIEFENGTIKRSSANQSYALHNLLCFGRLESPLTKDQTKRLGWAGSTAYDKDFFSSAWNYFLESNFSQNNMKDLINKFNDACNRDFNNGYLDNKVKIVKINKLNKETLKITLSIDSSQTDIIIQI